MKTRTMMTIMVMKRQTSPMTMTTMKMRLTSWMRTWKSYTMR